MKNMKRHESTDVSLLQRIACKIGDKLEQIGADPRNCWNATIYEPELPEELIKEMINP
ncbi:MAG: hypothetical protein FWF81_11775 [Defluviitaleaceae bacterium]|nr:hypothetical protein [Defluviitaleaceae bacterium]